METKENTGMCQKIYSLENLKSSFYGNDLLTSNQLRTGPQLMRLPASWENLSRYCVSIVRRTSCKERYKLNFSIFSVGEESASPKVVDAGEHAFIYNTHKWQNVDRVGSSGENGTEKKR